MPDDRESRYDSTDEVSPADVLRFWLGPDGSPPLANATKWYKKDDAFDREIADRFGDTLELAARGGLDGWKTTPRGRLALVIVLDQFSRNVYRGGPRSFAQDARACDLTLAAIAGGDEASLTIVERWFLYMPLMHAEDADLQRQCVSAFERLERDAPEDLAKSVANSLDYAKRHAVIVERFGRFPHRNAILGRSSTPEELEFLKQPGSSF
ncbi:MAG: DUF924 domain-containing protein [Labilithrix sp.]|nr:DUF924 domain-containing protein [Labilithrix sp.]